MIDIDIRVRVKGIQTRVGFVSGSGGLFNIVHRGESMRGEVLAQILVMPEGFNVIVPKAPGHKEQPVKHVDNAVDAMSEALTGAWLFAEKVFKHRDEIMEAEEARDIGIDALINVAKSVEITEEQKAVESIEVQLRDERDPRLPPGYSTEIDDAEFFGCL